MSDSAILVVDQAAQGQLVHPIYVRFGLAWERVEEAHLRRFLDAVPDQPGIRPLTVLELPIADVYGTHWSVSGTDTPDDTTPDEAVYLPGRNLLLLAKTTVWCALHDVGVIALGTLRGQPVHRRRHEFLSGLACLASLALGHQLEVVTPFAQLSKVEVLDRGRRPAPRAHLLLCSAGWHHALPELQQVCGAPQGLRRGRHRDRTAYAAG